ncbi:hypothetical protein KEG38_50790 [Polyangium jinanense]|uniref:hypothetical protein n=1 Tax=Polyangium jinanense TaxID=2829994 RepID=UPI002342655E|nr:hypothetical protein [Polyangium jinanense]MDC3962209.1 hypothetical protein [Polyangium jinanense]
MTLRRSTRSLTYDLAWASARLGVAFLPAILFPSWITWTLTVLLVLGVVFLIVAAFMYSYVAACPGCGGLVQGLSLKMDCVGHQCDHCKRFVEVEGGRIVLTPPDRVSDVPSFGVLLRGSPGELPAICCTCGAPSTRMRALVMAGVSLDIPCCDDHEPSVRLRKAAGRVLLEVASLRFAQALGERDGFDVVGSGPYSDALARIPWISALAGIALTGLAFVIVRQELPSKQLLAGALAGAGAFVLMHFVVGAGFLVRRRLVRG